MSWPRPGILPRLTLEAHAKWAAHRSDFPANLLLAIIRTESSGNPWVTRYEPEFVWLVDKAGNPFSGESWFKRDRVAESHAVWAERVRGRMLFELGPTEFHGQSQSWGLMQIMGSLARELGLREPLGTLLLPSLNLEYGLKYLGRLRSRWPNRDDIIAAYNAGTPRKNADGTYVNQPYVDKVLSHMQEER